MKHARSRTPDGSLLRTAVLAGLALAWPGAPAHAAGALELIPQPEPLAILLVGFVVLIFPLNALIFQPIFRALDAREEKIAGARRRASKLESEAQQLLHRYRDAIREVREETEADRRQQVEAARSEQHSVAGEARTRAESELAHTRSELSTSLEEARAQLRGEADQLARTAAERVLGRSLS